MPTIKNSTCLFKRIGLDSAVSFRCQAKIRASLQALRIVWYNTSNCLHLFFRELLDHFKLPEVKTSVRPYPLNFHPILAPSGANLGFLYVAFALHRIAPKYRQFIQQKHLQSKDYHRYHTIFIQLGSKALSN